MFFHFYKVGFGSGVALTRKITLDLKVFSQLKENRVRKMEA